MRLTFSGAAHEVTGSCHYLQACGKKILIDCGMQQGADSDDSDSKLPINPSEVDYVLLTHAHIDHSGRIPLLAKHGFHGSILATGATVSLCGIMLRDSAHIQEFEAEWRNRKAKRAGAEPYEPMYTMQDAEDAITHFVPYNYGQIIKLCDGIQVRFTDIGHLLGSASIEVWIEENDVKKKLVFSGDIGNINQPLIKDPQYIADADYVIIESTYGDRNHGEVPNYYEELASVIQRTFDRGGNVVIPSFAVGRTQELLYFMRKIIEMGMVKGYSKIPVYVDSPLANEATNIFNKNVWGYFDDEAMELVSKGINPISFPGLKTSVTSDDSKAINFTEESKVIISASGMCEAGRIKHHLKHNLWRKESTIVFVGFQAVGTLGRSILDGAKSVKLFGEPIAVNAEIVRLQGVSGHADQTGLIKWVNNFEPKPERVFVVHGETSVCTSFANLLHDEFALDTVAPYEGAVFDLESNSCLEQGLPPQPKQPKATAEQYRTSAVFARLCAAGERLMKIIRKNDQGANKDLAKFADQINAICDKWDR